MGAIPQGNNMLLCTNLKQTLKGKNQTNQENPELNTASPVACKWLTFLDKEDATILF